MCGELFFIMCAVLPKESAGVLEVAVLQVRSASCRGSRSINRRSNNSIT
jgi:hypothetical protein